MNTPATPAAATPATPPKPAITFPLPIVAVIGDSGTGKSTSWRNMPWDRTAVIDTEMKGFPFERATIDKIQHYYPCDTVEKVFGAMLKIKAMPAIRYAIHDSFTKFAEHNIESSKMQFKGYDIYNNYADVTNRYLKMLRSNTQIHIILGIPEFLKEANESGTERSVRRLFVHGKQNEGKIEKEFLVVFYTTMKADKETKKMQYSFLTNSDGICSAKSPMGMFPDLLIPNDLAAALQRIDK